MRPRRHPVRVALTLVVALLATLVATTGAPAQARVDKQRVYGAINCPKVAKCPNIKMLWFDRNWQYLGTQRANGGGYSLRLAAGSYHLQFVDQRPSWDTSKYAPTDIAVTVRSRTVSKSVTMKPGAAFTGVARAGGKPLGGARIVAANKAEQSFATTANKKGQFAVGGLPAGKYCLFTYDKAKRYVDTCTWAGGVNFGQVKDQPVTLAKKAGNLTVFLDVKGGGNAPASTVTVTSRTTGQWWTAKARKGKAVLRGLYPGRYTIKYDGAGIWFTQSGAVHGGKVRPGRMAFGDFTLTERGGWLTGSLVDASAPTYALQPQGTQPGALVMLFAQDGTKLAQTTSDADGNFTLTGQLHTQSGMTIVVDPSGSSGGFMQGERVCLFTRTELSGYQVTEGQEQFIDAVPVDRNADQPDPACDASAGRQSTRRSSSAQ